MANISREEGLKDLEERIKYGHRLHGRDFVSNSRSKQYNAIHGINLCDDEALDRYLANLRTLSNLK